jgi:hypothetical protein
MKRFTLSMLLVVASGCMTPGKVWMLREPSEPLVAPREVVLRGHTPPTNVELYVEDALRARGFRVKVFASAKEVSETVVPGRLDTISEPLTRFLLTLNYRTSGDCWGRGVEFSWLNVDVIDLHTRERVAVMSGQGHSEGCQFGGPMFETIAALLDKAWRAPADSAPAKPAGSPDMRPSL